MTQDEMIRRCEELAEQCEKLARQAERTFSFPVGQAIYNAGASLEDAAIMARGLQAGRKPRRA